MQTADKVTTTEEALAHAEFAAADARYVSAKAEVQRYRYEHPALTNTVACALLEANRDELNRDRNAKLARWASLKPSNDVVTYPKDTKPICEKCGSDLLVRLPGTLHCNACGFQN